MTKINKIKKVFSSVCFFVFLLTNSILFAEDYNSSFYNSVRMFYGPHAEIADLVSKKTGIPIEYLGLTFYTDSFHFSVLDTNLLFKESSFFGSNEYIHSIPYIYDDCVMVSRPEDSVDVLMNYEKRRFITYKDNPFGREWAEPFGIRNYNDCCNSVAEVFYKIANNQADYTFISSRLAYLLRDELGFNEELAISHPVFGIEYRFVTKTEDYHNIEAINTAIIEMLEFNEIDDIYLKYGLRSRVEPYIKPNVGFTTLIAILFIILFGAIFVMLKLREKNHWREI